MIGNVWTPHPGPFPQGRSWQDQMTTRWTILPDPRFAEMQGALRERLGFVARSIEPENFASLLDPLARQVLDHGLAEAGAHEGTIWLQDSEGKHLVPAYNTGPNAEKIVGKFRQPLNAGLISMVFASEQPIVENDVYKNARQSKLLDETLHVQTLSLIAAPLHFLKGCRGVVSCVQLEPQLGGVAAPPCQGSVDQPGIKRTGAIEEAAGFQFTDLRVIQRTASLLSQLIELRLLSSAVGWSD